jgi:16S rRNA (cytosine1402-N4)-methyltransferase
MTHPRFENVEQTPHIPVMCDEVVAALNPQNMDIIVDGTLGAGGYTRAILEKASCKVIGIDRDDLAHKMAQEWGINYADRLHLVRGDFADMDRHVRNLGFDKVDGVVLDLGISSMQIDMPERGFSFRYNAPLDMRMDQRQDLTAADLVNTLSQDDLAFLIWTYGEERYSRRVAGAIVKARSIQKITTTFELANIVRSVLPYSHKDKSDPATRTFQALRLKVNDELGQLERALDAAENILKDGGRLVIVTFHSLEDRIVKNFLNARAKDAPQSSRHIPLQVKSNARTFSLLTRKPQTPSPAELAANSRSRSAKLRAATRVYTEAVA